MLLKGFGFSGYRSIGDEIVRIGPLKKVNFIIGQNNVGKSNIVNFLNDQYAYFVGKAKNQRHFGQNQQGNPCDAELSHIKCKSSASHFIPIV